jgi:hypothetical protein
MEAPCPHGALSSKERDEDIPPPLIFNDIQRFSREILYDVLKRNGVGIPNLGKSQAVAVGAYAFALHALGAQEERLYS